MTRGKPATRQELLALAQRLRILGRTLLTKAQLVRAIGRKQGRPTMRRVPPAMVRSVSHEPLPARPLRKPSWRRAPATSQASGQHALTLAGEAGEALPGHYSQTILVAQARDPYGLHAYWDVLHDGWAKARRALGASAHTSQSVLRVYELSRPAPDAVRQWFDVTLMPDARDWYVAVDHPASWWRLEIGLRAPDGRFVCVVRSNLVETPSDRPSSEVDEAWGVLGGAFASQYQLPGPPGSSPGSPRWRTR